MSASRHKLDDVPSTSLGFRAAGLALLGLGVGLGSFLGACASDAPKSKAVDVKVVRPVGRAIAFKDVKPILEKNCVTGCHGPGGTQSGVPLDDLNRIKVLRPDVYMRLTSQETGVVMPQGNTDFKTTEDGKFLIEWLRVGDDVRTEETLVPGSGKPAGKAVATPAGAGTAQGTVPVITPAGAGTAQGTVPVLTPEVYGAFAFPDVEAIARARCGTCHEPGGALAKEAGNEKAANFPLVSVADWKTLRSKSLEALKKGSMPKGAGGGPELTFLNSEDGKILFGWLQFGTDF